MHTKPNHLTAGATALLAVLAIAMPFDASALKCWENDEGGTECGDAVPPEFAQKGHVEKSKSGVTLNKQERAKTEEELAAEKEEAEALAKQQAEEDEIKKETAARDRVLLATYMVEEDITMARDGRMAAIDTRVKHTATSTTKLDARLVELQAEAAKLERNSKEIPPKLLADITKMQDPTRQQPRVHRGPTDREGGTHRQVRIRSRPLS